MPFAWTRTNFGLVYVADTTAAGVSTAQSKVDADAATSPFAAAATAEATYQTDRTSLTGADANLKMVVTGPTVPPSAANPGV